MKNYIKDRELENSGTQARISNEVRILKAKYYEKEPFDIQVDIDRVFEEVAKIIPSPFLDYIDTIIVGQFDFLDQRDLDALYSDASIYLSNKDKEVESDIVDDIVHEIAHAVEENNQHIIYSDNMISAEFLSKRNNLYFLLKENGFNEEVDFYDFDNLEYDEQFDMFLYQEVSYPLLDTLTTNIFCSPYGATSLREYFANCFEHYFYSSTPKLVKAVSPRVHDKIQELLNTHEN